MIYENPTPENILIINYIYYNIFVILFLVKILCVHSYRRYNVPRLQLSCSRKKKWLQICLIKTVHESVQGNLSKDLT